MKVFISWSGTRSQRLAQALREWLPLVLHFVEPWVSQSDINAGERWTVEVSKELQASNFGVICLTQDNINAPWILFEAGALAKSLEQGRVIPLLLDIDFKDISGPLSQFQAKKVDKVGINELVASIKKATEQEMLEVRLNQLFQALWPTLEQKIAEIPANEMPPEHRRQTQDVLEELVAGIRGLELRFRDIVGDSQRLRRRNLSMHPMMLQELGESLGRSDPVRLLVMAGMLKDEIPWIYELAVDVYRASVTERDPTRTIEAQRRFRSALMMIRKVPLFENLLMDKMSFMALRHLEELAEENDFLDKPPANRDTHQDRDKTS